MTPEQSRRRKAAVVFLALLVTALGVRAEGEKTGLTFGLKLSGGVGLLPDGAGDLEKARQGTVDQYLAMGRMPGYTSHAKWDKASALPALEGELIFQIGRSFGIGIGSGFISVRSRGEYGTTIDQTQSLGTATYIVQATSNYSSDYKLTAVPVQISFYGFLPLGRWSLYGRAGLGYYFGHLTNAAAGDVSLAEQLNSPTQPDVRGDITARIEVAEDSRTNALGFHGGLGVEYRLGAVAFGLECFGRYAQFSGWSGDINSSVEARLRQWKEGTGWWSDETTTTTQTETGKLYSYEVLDSDSNQYYGQMRISKDKPFGIGIRNSGEAKINLNTLGLVFSVRFYFN